MITQNINHGMAPQRQDSKVWLMHDPETSRDWSVTPKKGYVQSRARRVFRRRFLRAPSHSSLTAAPPQRSITFPST